MFERGKQDGVGEGVASLIDADMRITGTVVSSGDIILAGGVEGEIQCRSLYIEERATFNGTVNADETIIAGNVTGEVKADILRVKSSGNFDGVVKAKGLEVEDGAVVQARVRKVRR